MLFPTAVVGSLPRPKWLLDLFVAHQDGRMTDSELKSEVDKAIGFAETFFVSPRGRLGTIGLDDLTEVDKALIKKSNANFAIIIYDKLSSLQFDEYVHNYFRNSPGASSDLILMLRDDLDPGSNGRPLESLGLMFWRIPPGYPANEPSQ